MSPTFADHAGRIKDLSARTTFEKIEKLILELIPVAKEHLSKEHVNFLYKTEFCKLYAQKEDFAVDLKVTEGRSLRDPKGWFQPFEKRKGWGNIERVNSKGDLEYVLYLILQTFIASQVTSVE